MIKKMISFVTITILLCNAILPAFALNTDDDSIHSNDNYSFIDSEGKYNSIEALYNNNSVTIRYYIDDVCINEATTTLVGDIFDTFLIEYSENNEIQSHSYTRLSDFIATSEAINDRSYSYQGTIKYKPYITAYGTYNYKLKIYHSPNGSILTTYTINKAAGTAVSVIVSLLCAAIEFFSPAWGTPLIRALVSAVGGEIINGIITAAITKTVAAYKYTYDVKAVDPDTNRIRFYIGHKYKIAESTAGYTKFYYDGYYPYNSNSTSAAYWMYCDFWASGGYPGVQSFY